MDDAPADEARYPIAMTLRQWGIIDSAMDNEINVEVVEGDPRRIVELADSIREAGWDQIAHWTPGVPGSGAWPPPDEIVEPRLTAQQWALVPIVLRRWADAAERTGRHDAAAASRDLQALLDARLNDLAGSQSQT
ncbi:hypothetical protein [Nonomuraea sp. CA-141351]|uniref:hypothetical protein n=1 Tax=Nonomuraea sp. CA-141351 TaxID=3239996 RepID=UPI003D9428EC